MERESIIQKIDIIIVRAIYILLKFNIEEPFVQRDKQETMSGTTSTIKLIVFERKYSDLMLVVNW